MRSTTAVLKYGAFCAVCVVGALGGTAMGVDGATGPRIDYYEGTAPLIDYRASTPFEGYSRGLSDLIRSQAAYNLTTAEALKKLAEAAQEDIRTREQWTHTYFQLREANRLYRAREEGPRPTPEDIVRYAQMGKPERLSPGEIDAVTGDIAWPGILRDGAFAEDRGRMERLFTDWIHYGTLTVADRQQIRRTTNMMMEKLQERIEDVPPADYITARRFLESLAYEAYLASR